MSNDTPQPKKDEFEFERNLLNDKIKQPHLDINAINKSKQSDLAKAWALGFKTREEWIGKPTPEPENPYLKEEERFDKTNQSVSSRCHELNCGQARRNPNGRCCMVF